MKAAEVTGAAIAILNDGKVVYTKAYGFRDKKKNVPLTTDSVMSGASFTKATFAYFVMQLVDEGTLDLDKPIYQYLAKPLPEYPRYADLAGDERYKKITARMLLSHTAGFPNWRIFEDDRKLKIHFEPGSRYAYSGEGIDLLQLVIETITKKPLAELMRDRLFTPLGMSRTSMTWQDGFEPDIANGYDEYGRSLGADKNKDANAAGSLLTTITDYGSFLAAVANGKLLRLKTREQMLTPQIRITSKHQFPSLANEPTTDNDSIQLS
jgi:CubicO group peptidase (beta-lactamase class C family)